MRRRNFITLLGGAAVAWTRADTFAAQKSPTARIGILVVGTPPIEWMNVLKAGLHALGWREGENLQIEERHGNGDAASLPPLATELVALPPDVLIAVGTSETKALQAATSDIPIVFMMSSDPVGMGIVDSIAHPGRNTTGLSISPQVLWGKRLELIVELIGHQPTKVAWLGNPGNVATKLNLAAVTQAAKQMSIKLEPLEARRRRSGRRQPRDPARIPGSRSSRLAARRARSVSMVAWSMSNDRGFVGSGARRSRCRAGNGPRQRTGSGGGR
jgi:putative tryptophan/tyrosine transport system substrate-binding protein